MSQSSLSVRYSYKLSHIKNLRIEARLSSQVSFVIHYYKVVAVAFDASVTTVKYRSKRWSQSILFVFEDRQSHTPYIFFVFAKMKTISHLIFLRAIRYSLVILEYTRHIDSTMETSSSDDNNAEAFVYTNHDSGLRNSSEAQKHREIVAEFPRGSTNLSRMIDIVENCPSRYSQVSAMVVSTCLKFRC